MVLTGFASGSQLPAFNLRVLKKQQLEELYLEVTGVPLEEGDLEADALITLWRQLYSVEASATKAWAGVLSAILRDPAVLFY